MNDSTVVLDAKEKWGRSNHKGEMLWPVSDSSNLSRSLVILCISQRLCCPSYVHLTLFCLVFTLVRHSTCGGASFARNYCQHLCKPELSDKAAQDKIMSELRTQCSDKNGSSKIVEDRDAWEKAPRGLQAPSTTVRATSFSINAGVSVGHVYIFAEKMIKG